MTLAVDLVIRGIQEPVRFLLETKVKIFPTNERFWYFSKKLHSECFILQLKEVSTWLPYPGEGEDLDAVRAGLEAIDPDTFGMFSAGFVNPYAHGYSFVV